MEGETTIDPLDVKKHPKIIKDAQNELGKLDILVCGQCHMVFHFVEQFQDHRLMGNCSGVSTIRENNINESKAQVWAFLLWKGSQNLEENENSWVVYQRWCKMDAHAKEAWIVAGRNVQVFTKLSAAKMQEVRTKVQVKPKSSEDEPLEEGEIKRSDLNKMKNNKSGDEFSEDPLADTDDPMDTDTELDTEEEADREEMEKLKNINKTNNNSDIKKEVNSEGEENKQGNQSPTTKKVQQTNSTSTSTSTTSSTTGTSTTTTVTSPSKPVPRIATKTNKTENTTEQGVIQNILAKRFNPRRKMHEYLIKWENCPHEQNTWEPAAHLQTCKELLESFERNLERQKEARAARAAANAALVKQQNKDKKSQPSTSAILPQSPGGRPQRTSKQKALNQVKTWCGTISDRDDELGLKRRGSSDSEDDLDEKKIKLEYDSGSEDEWTAEVNEPERTGSIGRPKILSKSASTVNGVAKKMTASEVAKSIGLASPDRETSTIVGTKVVKVYQRTASGVYMVNRKDGLVNVSTASSNTPNIVRVIQKTAGSQPGSIVKVGPNTQVRILQKSEVPSGAVRLSPGMSRTNVTPKLKTNIRPAIRTPAGKLEKLTPQRTAIGTPQLKVVRSGKTTGVTKPSSSYDTLDQLDKESSESEDDFDPFPKDLPPPEPDSPPREFTLDPETGLILGQAEGEPEPQLQEEPAQPAPEEQQQTQAELQQVQEALQSAEEPKQEVKSEVKQEEDKKEELIIPGTEIPEGTELGITKPEEAVAVTAAATTATITLPEGGEPLMITGEDGVVYQVAGQNEEGQTLLVAQGVDGEQQCVYVTAAAAPEEPQESSSVLTLDTAVAEAMSESDAPTEALTVDTAMEGEEGEPSGHVVAQLVRAEAPSPGGTRKVVLLLPDGNILMTEVDAEQYAALELDK